jgi:hypothetical protein
MENGGVTEYTPESTPEPMICVVPDVGGVTHLLETVDCWTV